MFRILTVAREFGSGGGDIARTVAAALNWRLLDREIVDEVVRMAGVERDAAERCDESLDPVYYRLLKSLWQGGFETGGTQIGASGFDSTEMTRCARSVIEQAAKQGSCVIVGRGAQCILSDRDDTIHAFVWAPRAFRIDRIRARLPEQRDPEALMDRMDRARSAFMRREFNVNWYDYRLYDLMVNSALGDATAVECMATAVRGELRANA